VLILSTVMTGPEGSLTRRRLTTTSSAVLLVALLLSVGLTLPTVRLGFAFDDYMIFGLAEGWHDVEEAPANLYASFLDLPYNPWWTAPELTTGFWRPLTSALFRLDKALFGRHEALYHLQNLLWLAAVVLGCAVLYRRLSPPVGILALLFVAAEEAHAFTSGVICNRHAVISTAFCLAGLHAHLRWREEGRHLGLPLSLACFVVALLAGETGLALMAYVLAYELAGAEEPLAKRLRAVLPAALLAVAYVLLYKAMGWGPRNFAYLNPLEDPPGEVLATLAQRLPVFLAGTLAALPTHLLELEAWRLPYVAAGVAVPAALAGVLRLFRARLRDGEARALRFWVLGALGAFVPLALAFPGERQYLVPTVGFAPLLATCTVVAWRVLRRPAEPGGRRLLAAAVVLALATAHLGIATSTRWRQQNELIERDAMEDRAAQALALELPSGAVGQGVVLVQSSDFGKLVYAPAIYHVRHGYEALTWSAMSAAPVALRWTRTADRTLVLEPVDGGLMFASFLEQLFRLTPVAAGDVFPGPLFDAEVAASNGDGVTRVVFRFHRDLEGPDLTFVVWDGDTLRRIEPPGLGASVVVEPTEAYLGP